MAANINPVFVKAKDIPAVDNSRPPTVLDICLAAERSAGQGSVVGAQQIRGLWRIYPATKEARSQLLLKGLRLRGIVLQLANTNPFLLRNDTGEEKPSTKVFIDRVPISVADSEIEHALIKAGCELRSSIKPERARDPDHKLTRFLTGKRFLFITVPKVPLEKTLKVSIFTATVYHREQKLVHKNIVCSNCLEQNHHSSQCDRDVVCRVCRQPGHKQGDPLCQLSPSDQPRMEKRRVHGERGETVRKENVNENGVREKSNAGMSESEMSELQEKNTGKDNATRGRTTARQTTLGTSLGLRRSPRNRSSTPKRPRSLEASPETVGHKQVKTVSRQSDCSAEPEFTGTVDTDHR